MCGKQSKCISKNVLIGGQILSSGNVNIKMFNYFYVSQNKWGKRIKLYETLLHAISTSCNHK